MIINYRTPDLTERAIRSLRRWYPLLSLLIVDNGSGDESRSLIERCLSTAGGPAQTVWNETNLHHGPAMDQAARRCDTPYVFFLDSDCEVHAGGFLELMLGRMTSDPQCYATGKLTHMDRRGFDRPPGEEAIPYIRPVAMLVRREIYLGLKPFQRHGAPCLDNMADARARGFVLSDFPIDRYIGHEGRGTAARHGYNLGWRGRINHLLHKLGL